MVYVKQRLFGIVVFLTALLFNASAVSFAATNHFTKNLSMSYTDTGEGLPIVLVHAFPTDQRLWQPQIDELQKYFRIITLDLYGFGQAEPTHGEAYRMSDYADQVQQLLTQLHIQKAIIAGESMGGYIALSFLEKYPESVSALILSDTQSSADDIEAQKKREASAVDVLTNGTTNLIAGFMPKALSNEATKETKDFLLQILISQKATGVASALRGMALRADTSNVLANSAVPMLIITGQEDTLIKPMQSETMHRLAKNSKLLVIPKAGHLSSLEQPKIWNSAVINFVRNDVR